MSKEKAERSLARPILRWYRTHRRRLPWRETKDPYRVWISEVMLQQTTVSTVIPYYTRWLTLFPDIGALAGASLRQVLKAWEGLGYYQRAKNAHRTAQIICREYGSAVPAEYKELISLPGIGPYIAAAVLSIAYGEPYPVLDANVRRLGMRFWAIPGKACPRTDRALMERLLDHFPAGSGGDFNQALMELGAVICRPHNPRCLLCPIQEFCRAFRKGAQEIIPPPRKRSTHKIEAVIAVITDGRRYLIQKRPPEGLLADLWEFPGGKRERGETLREALRREIKEELDAEVRRERRFLKLRHAYTRFQVTLFAFHCELKGPPRLKRSVHRWVSLSALKRYPFPSGSAKVVRFLEDSGPQENLPYSPAS